MRKALQGVCGIGVWCFDSVELLCCSSNRFRFEVVEIDEADSLPSSNDLGSESAVFFVCLEARSTIWKLEKLIRRFRDSAFRVSKFESETEEGISFHANRQWIGVSVGSEFVICCVSSNGFSQLLANLLVVQASLHGCVSCLCKL